MALRNDTLKSKQPFWKTKTGQKVLVYVGLKMQFSMM